jgi:putative protease
MEDKSLSKIPEILAPAGSSEALKSAIKAGADAVYLSGKKFGARQFADNFTLPDIEESINYAHLRGVKVYVTVNTLIKDHEILPVLEYLIKLYEMGVDAVLVQDLGLTSLAREILPDLTLHASTQMTIHNVDGLKWAQDIGFKRVVLSRELSLDEIKEMNSSSNIELEIFLHGALCYCYSGQCLLSSFIGGRSGNRGMCAQPCRKPYELVAGAKDDYGRPSQTQEISLKDEYLLSPKDLALYSNLNLLMGSGVSSLKIEGRMRSPEYVAVVVSTYRQALDKIKKGKWKPSPQDLENLKLTFNRGLTPGHLLKSRGKQLMGREKPGHRGLHLGKVKKYNPHKKEVSILLKTITRPQKGDGLFFVPSNKYNGVGIDVEQNPRVKGNEIFLMARKPVPVGSEVYLTRRQNLIKDVSPSSQLNDNQNSGTLKKSELELLISFKLNENSFPELIGELETNRGQISVNVIGKTPMEKAISRPLSKKDITKQLLKLGDKPFKAKIDNFEYSGELFLPLSELNKIRRDLIDRIELKLLKSYHPNQEDIIAANSRLNKLRKKLKKDPTTTQISQVSKSTYKSLKSPNKQKTDNVIYNTEKKSKEIYNAEYPNSVRLSVYLDDLNNIRSAIDAGFSRIYFDPLLISLENLKNRCFSKSSPTNFKYDLNYITETLREAHRLCGDSKCDLIWKWPDITHSKVLDFIKRVENEISTSKKDPLKMNIMVGSPGIAKYLKDNYGEIKIYGSSALNVWNHQSAEYLDSCFSLMTLSPELSYKDLQSIFYYKRKNNKNYDLELLVQGNLEAIISGDCVISPDWLSSSQIENFADFENFWGLKDEKNRTFPIKITSECQTIILNSVETCLVNHIPSIINLGVQNLAIDGRGRGEKYIQKIGHYYNKAIQSSYQQDNPKELERIKKQIQKISRGGITAGNFLRGVELQ